ncbi:hypothetical protein E8E13_007369 [Curvularia kusanoi]|uniref:F-box domain-containing protein n=1 Tax=Curvularia kusanoi TaxID=90978 RepID=A0A9P4W7X4_CURKU|nr:hypothetical protein E8E13_007369 [Curvularia kusanoi]
MDPHALRLSSPSDSPEDTDERPRFNIDDMIAAREVELDDQFRAPDAKRRDEQIYKDKHEANEREMKNHGYGIFKLPAEIRMHIYKYLVDDEALQVTLLNGKACLVDSNALAILGICRQIRKEVAELPFNKAFKFVTFRYISMLDSWKDAIRGDPELFLEFLRSIRAPEIKRFEVVGVMGGSDGLEKMQTPKIKGKGRNGSPNYKDEMAAYIHIIYPKAEVTFNDVADIGKI